MDGPPAGVPRPDLGTAREVNEDGVSLGPFHFGGLVLGNTDDIEGVVGTAGRPVAFVSLLSGFSFPCP